MQTDGEVHANDSEVADAFAAIAGHLGDYVEQGRVAGIAFTVARRGRTIFKTAVGRRDLASGLPMTTDTLCRCYSMTKTLTAVAVLQLRDHRCLDLDDPVEKYLPDLRERQVAWSGPDGGPVFDPAATAMTIRQLLTHSAGLAHGLGSKYVLQHPVEQLYQNAGLHSDIFPLTPRGKGSRTVRELVAKLSRLPLRYQPGTEIQYSIAYDVLAGLVEVVSGQRFDRYLAEHICGPLGMSDTTFVLDEEQRGRMAALYAYDQQGQLCVQDEMTEFGYSGRRTFFGGSEILSSADDWIRLVCLLCEGGEYNGRRLLSAQSVAEMTMPVDSGPPKKIVNMAGTELGHRIGYGVMVLNDASAVPNLYCAQVGEYWWAGAAHTCFWVDPVRQVAFVLMMQLFLAQCQLREELKPLVLRACSVLDARHRAAF